MKLPRISHVFHKLVSGWLVLSFVLLACSLSLAEAFMAPSPFGTMASHPVDTALFASKAQKNRPTDRYSSRSIAGNHVAEHVQQMYEEGHTYQKTIRKTKRVDEVSNDAGNVNSEATIPRNTILNQLNRYPALILNADYQPMSYLPLSVCHWQEAIKSVFSGKVAVVDVYEGVTVRAANLEIPLPSVIALTEYVPQSTHRPAFTRRNVFLRDEYTCQYCKESFHIRDLSIDHVLPRSMGGQLNWENAVTSCLTCNGRKGNMLVRDLKSIGMKLRTEPRAPSRRELAGKAGKMLPRKVHPTWQPYMGGLVAPDDTNNPTADLETLEVYDDYSNSPRSSSRTVSEKKKKSSTKKKRKNANKAQEVSLRR